MQIAKEHVIEGFTITGGDPLYQADDLQQLILLLHTISDDILVYTGYSIGELGEESLKGIAVLIDGEYIESRNTDCVLPGSDNQSIHILDQAHQEKYSDYLSQNTNQIQNFMTSDGIISVGIHRPNFMEELNNNLSRKGVSRNA